MSLHEDYCGDAHSDLCGFGEGVMHPDHCRKPIEGDAGNEFHDENCEVATCQSCLWTCDGSRDDGRDCSIAYCPSCMPTDLKASIEAAKERGRQSGRSAMAGHEAQCCGDCVGDGGAWEEQQEQRRSRKRALESLQRGEYVHPSHYMDEDAYHAGYAGDADGSEHSE